MTNPFRRVTTHWKYAIPLLLYFSLTVLYLKTIPPGESPDEPSHLQCIEQVTQYNRIPIIEPKPRGTTWWARERIISGLVCAHMPLYYLVAGYTEQVVQTITRLPAHYEFPPNNPAWATGKSAAMFLHPSDPSAAEPSALIVLRLESIAVGVMTILSAGVVAQQLVPARSEAPLIAMILVAGWPQFVFMSRAINNDVLATAFSSATLAVLVFVNHPKRFVAASALAALAVLSKITMTFIAAAVVGTLALEIIVSHRRKKYVWPGLISLAIFGVTAALILVHPVLRSDLEWSEGTIGSINSAAGTFDYWIKVLYTTLQSGWAYLGWMNIPTPDWQVIGWWTLLVIGGILGAWIVWRSEPKHPARLMLMICGVWLLAILAGYVRINLNRFQPQFRYAFAMVPVLAALAATGWTAIGQRVPRFTEFFTPTLALILLAANVWIILMVIPSAYP